MLEETCNALAGLSELLLRAMFYCATTGIGASSQDGISSGSFTCACGYALEVPFPCSALPIGVLPGSEGVGYLRHVREGGLPHLGDETQLHTVAR